VAFSPITLDWRALGFALGVSLLVGIGFGLVPALGATRGSLTDALKDGSARSRDGAPTSVGRRGLVVAEIALALILLAGSGLMIHSLSKLLAINPGYDGRNVLTFRIGIPPDGLPRDSMPAFYDRIDARLRALPGVTDVALGNCAPLSGGCSTAAIQFHDRPATDLAHAPSIGVHWATPNWFSALRVPLRRGRLIADGDRLGTPQVVVVNDVAAQQFWPAENPIGKRVEISMGGFDDAEVIGVVGSVRVKADSSPRPEVYVAFAQSPRPGMMVFLRSARDPNRLVPDVRRVMHEVAPQLPIYDLRTMDDRAAGATAQARFTAMLLGLFALTALSLAAVGIYGVMSLVVTARTREIGIRVALGADRGRVQRLVLGESALLAGIGGIIGLAGALAATRVLRSVLFDLAPTDPVTYVTIVALLAATVGAASWIPARRASRVNPVVALRAD
jgi:putative ABC transport system permease protein